MRVGIDASNIRAGGGLTHLIEVLDHATPSDSNVVEVVVWSTKESLDKMPNREWLIKDYQPMLNKSLVYRVFWQKFILPKLASRKCDILFCPGGTYSGSFSPYVSMSQNMLVFEKIAFTQMRNHVGKVSIGIQKT